MERKIIDKKGKVVRQWKVRDKSHLIGCLKNPSNIYRNKKKYTRKQKYKNKYEGE